VIVAEGYRRRSGSFLSLTSTARFYNEMGVHLKNIAWGSPFFRDPLRPIHNLTTSPIQFCCQRAYIRCHHVETVKKKKSIDGMIMSAMEERVPIIRKK
jgi:hypothetical protein